VSAVGGLTIETHTGPAGAGWPIALYCSRARSRRVPGVRSHCRCRIRGTEYFSEAGMTWVSGGATRLRGRARTGAEAGEGGRGGRLQADGRRRPEVLRVG
jgi:hypothetical protein